MSVKFQLLCGLLALVGSVTAHVCLADPPPRRSSHLPGANYENIDYSMTSPIGTESHAAQPFCKGYAAGTVGATYAAGSTINVAFQVGAAHGGGVCQYALSYDDGKTFAVIKTDTQCLIGSSSASVSIPADAPPSDHVVFGWTWLNNLGNREYYMNCADIAVTGGKSGGSVTGLELLVANYPGYPGLPENLDGVKPLLAARNSIIVSVPSNYQAVDYSTVSFPVISANSAAGNASTPSPVVYASTEVTTSSSVAAVSSNAAVVYPTTSDVTSSTGVVYPTTNDTTTVGATSTTTAVSTRRRCRVYKTSSAYN